MKMSGIMSGNGRDDLAQHYVQRFNELTQKNPNKSLATSTVGSLSESVVNGRYLNKAVQIANGTLSTHQFYNNNSNQDPRIPSNQLLAEGSSTYTGVSDDSVFKKPLPVKRITRTHIDRRLDLLVETLRSIDDKTTLKFMMTTIETLVHAVKYPPTHPANPVQLIDYISNLIKAEYLAKRVPKSICGSSLMSDQLSTIDQYTGNSERSIRLDKPPGTTLVSDSRVALQDITQSSIYRAEVSGLRQGITNYDYPSIGRTGLSSYHQQEASTMRGRLPETLTASTFNLFNDSEIAQRRDEAAAAAAAEIKSCCGLETVRVVPKKTSKTSTPKPTMNSTKVSRMKKAAATANKKPSNRRSKESVAVSENSTIDNRNNNKSQLNGTVPGVSRCGRKLKAPTKYWARDEESSYENKEQESALNESMTLRNKKILDKKKTPPVRGSKNNTPTLPDIRENDVSIPSTTKKARGRPSLSGKENIEKKKLVQKPTDTPAVKRTLSKGKASKKKEDIDITNQNTEKPVKKPQKRKAKEPKDMISKKKKVEESVLSDDDEDDIFGTVSYRKPTHQNLKVALSPSAALLSAKKAAGEAQGKATPPCKYIGDMMVNESIQSTMSAAKEAPKQNEAVKRIIKKMEKNQMKAPTQSKAKTQVKNSRKEESRVNDLMEAVKSSYSVSNPMSYATLTVFRGNEQESDLSDMEHDDDDDDDLI